MKINVCAFNSKVSKHTWNPKFFYSGQEAEYCSKYKYIDIFFSRAKACSNQYGIILLVKQRKLSASNKYAMEFVGELSPKLQLKVFDSLILPILGKLDEFHL